MDVGMMMVFASYGWDDCSDARVWQEEIRLARLAADLGFDCLWSAEHHFNDYSFVPDKPAADDLSDRALPQRRSWHRSGHPALARPAACR